MITASWLFQPPILRQELCGAKAVGLRSRIGNCARGAIQTRASGCLCGGSCGRMNPRFQPIGPNEPTAEAGSVVFAYGKYLKELVQTAYARCRVIGGSRHANTADFPIEVGGSTRLSCPRRLLDHFTVATRCSARVFNCKCDRAREQHRIERGSAHQQSPQFLCPRDYAARTNNSKVRRENSRRM